MKAVFDILQIVGSLGIFIYGMKVMSEGLQLAAGNSLRRLLKGMTSSRVGGVLTGVGVTTLIQSSSATTVMVVSFVNAGLLTLAESMGVIMGANIGTTITAWMVTLFGFKVSITPIAIILIALFFPLLFAKRNRPKHIAQFVLGFGILFIGLSFLKDSVPDLKENSQVLEFLQHYTDLGFISVLIFVVIGTLLTIIVQSSSATMTITLIMLSKGWIPFDLAAAMVLGENIGTTITANIAATVGNVHAKRAARFHLVFNLIGVVWMLALMNVFLNFAQNSVGGIVAWLADTFNSPGLMDSDNNLLSLALFHSSFNIVNVLVLIWFVPWIGKLVERMVPVREDEDEEYRLKHISTGILSTPELSIENARKDFELFTKIVHKMGHNMYALMFEQQKRPEKLVEKISTREQITDNLELELATYLVKVSESDLSAESSERVRNMLSMANDLERIADIYFEMAKNYERLQELKVNFPEEAKLELKETMDLVNQLLQLTRENMALDPKEINVEGVKDLKVKVDEKREEVFIHHFKRLEKGVYNPQAGVHFLEFINRNEKIAHYLLNVNKSYIGVKKR